MSAVVLLVLWALSCEALRQHPASSLDNQTVPFNVSTRAPHNPTAVQQYSDIQSVFLMGMAGYGSDAGNPYPATPADMPKFYSVYLNGGTNPKGFKYPGFFPLMNTGAAPTYAQLWGAPWQVVWSGTYQIPLSSYATSLLYVAYSASQNTYVVGIAGTTGKAYDWLMENLQVLPKNAVPFTTLITELSTQKDVSKVDRAAYLSDAMATALRNLAKVTSVGVLPTGGTTGTPVNIAAFLARCQGAGRSLIFTGHSQGGATSPSLAAVLYPFGGSNLWASVRVLPFAGPTPGNANFAAWFAKYYPPIPGTSKWGTWTAGWSVTWNTNIANGQDVVPKGWDKISDIVQYKTLAVLPCPAVWGYATAVTAFGLDKAAKLVNALTQGYFKPLSFAYGIPRYTPGTTWPAQYWGKYDWTSYPPTWVPLPQYTQSKPFDALDITKLLWVSHVDQYYRMFGVTPMPIMQR